MRRSRFLFAVTAVAAFLSAGCGWTVETLDGSHDGPGGRVSGDVGEFSSAVASRDALHVFYSEVGSDALRHAHGTGTSWQFETLDGYGGPHGRVNTLVGRDSAAVDLDGRLHVFYRDVLKGDVRHAYEASSAWGFETLDGSGGTDGRVRSDVGEFVSAVEFGGHLHVFYADVENGSLRHASWTGSAWQFETLDGAAGPHGRVDHDVGWYTSPVVSGGRLRVFYWDAANDDLRQAYWTGSAWGFETLDGAGGADGRVDAIVGTHATAFTLDGRPHVSYRDDTHGDLRHAYWTGSAWGFETLDGTGGPRGAVDANVGRYGAVTLVDGRPHVFYENLTHGSLRHAHWTGATWVFETLDGSDDGNSRSRTARDVGEFTAAVTADGHPQVFYYDADNESLRHAWIG